MTLRLGGREISAHSRKNMKRNIDEDDDDILIQTALQHLKSMENKCTIVPIIFQEKMRRSC